MPHRRTVEYTVFRNKMLTNKIEIENKKSLGDLEKILQVKNINS